MPRYADTARRSAFYTGVLDRVSRYLGLPAPDSRRACRWCSRRWLPVRGRRAAAAAERGGQHPPGDARLPLGDGNDAARGRLLGDGDREGSEAAAVINQTMAGNASGRRRSTRSAVSAVAPPARGRAWSACREGPPSGGALCRGPSRVLRPVLPGRAVVPFMQPEDLAVRTTADPMLYSRVLPGGDLVGRPAQPIAQVRMIADIDEDLAPHRSASAAHRGVRRLRACCSLPSVRLRSCRTRSPSAVARWACGWRWAPSGRPGALGRSARASSVFAGVVARARHRLRPGPPDRRPALRRAPARPDDVRCRRRYPDRGCRDGVLAPRAPRVARRSAIGVARRVAPLRPSGPAPDLCRRRIKKSRAERKQVRIF